ncbi:MAG TPA: hypothetical protein VKR06_38325 [Ktedonosporobacter sp.]|nr:hypothetical protein [Ktedonosporobacter sp.]
MSITVQQPQAATNEKKPSGWSALWQHKKSEKTFQATILTEKKSQNFYEQAIEWTHRADKVINLVLGYLLAIASVLGFMDVLSNGEVLGAVPYAFYIWLAIMGLGVDFQILLVIGRIPDLARIAGNGWAKFLIFVFNIAFLAFLCYMSVVIAAVFTQHRDVPGTITEAMQALGINAISFVYERATLATLLLVLMAVDRTMERWRMQVQRGNIVQAMTQPQEASVDSPPAQPDIEKLLETMVAMNQQTLQTIQAMNQQAMKVTIEQFTQITLEAVREAVEQVIEASPGYQTPQIAESTPVKIDQQPLVTPSIKENEKPDRGLQNHGKSYGDQIEALYKENPNITTIEIEKVLGCSRTTAANWLKRVRPINTEQLEAIQIGNHPDWVTDGRTDQKTT